MESLMDEICGYIHNYFVVKPDGVHRGKYTISNGSIDCPFLQANQYFRIKGSVFNNGVHVYPANDLTDEEFTGEIWAMAVPQAVIALASEIEAWNAKYGGINSPNYSPFVSESFNNYSYSKGSRYNGGGSSSGAPMTWQDAFASRLSRWRRLSDAL